jgi:hypothetical protein
VVEPYVVNVSSVQDFAYCPFRWVCKWVENRVPRQEPRAFRFGKLFHKLFEWHQGEGLSKEEALSAASEQWIAECRDKDPNSTDWADAIEDLEAMSEPFLLWQDQYPFEQPVVEVEAPYIFPFPNDPSIYLKIRPDRVGIRVGKLWHVQHKALAAGKNFSVFTQLAQRSYHEHGYAEGLVHKYGLLGVPYGGTHFDLYRKLKYRRKPTLKQIAAGQKGSILNPVETLFWQHPMTVDLESPLHKHVMHCLHQKIVDMRETERRYREEGIIPAPNEDRNGGYYGNKPDEYFYVLMGDYQLDNNTYFKDREDTYAVFDPA